MKLIPPNPSFVTPPRQWLNWGLAGGLAWWALPMASASPDPPALSPEQGAVLAPARVTVARPDPLATVFYTVDGSDPRTVFGDVAATARAAGASISINRPVVIKARARSGTEWSPLVTGAYTVDQDFSNLLISELMYHPNGSGENAEFIEFVNVGREPLDVGGLVLRSGDEEGWIDQHFYFPLGTRVDPGSFLVLVRRLDAYRAIHPSGLVNGITTAAFNNSNARLRLESVERALAVEAHYESASPWPAAPDNHGYFVDGDIGFSLVRRDLDPATSPIHYSSWRASTQRGGSPGSDDPPSTLSPVYINELMTRGSAGTPDFVELYNPNDHSVDISGWWLTDERNEPLQYAMPAGSTIPPRGYLVVTATQFGPRLGFSGEGERCYIFSANTQGDLTGFSHGFQFSGTARGASFGRHVADDGSESFPVQQVPTPGAPNARPLIPPVVINRIGYSEGPARSPFVELYNRTGSDITLNPPGDPQATWALGSAPNTPIALPSGLVVRAHGSLILVRDDTAAFRQIYDVPAEVPVIPAQEILLGMDPARAMLLLFEPAGRAGDQIRRMTVEQVNWLPAAPWPPGANAIGYCLQRVNPHRFANDPANWRAAPVVARFQSPAPGNVPPRVWAGGPRLCFTGREFTLAGEVSDDAWDGMPPTMNWLQVDGPSEAIISSPTVANTRVRLLQPGTYRFQLEAQDGFFTAQDTAEIEVRDGGFETWALEHFPPESPGAESASRPDSDPDGDGATNLVEYILATPPLQADGVSPLEIRLETGHWAVIWSQRPADQDYEVTVESAVSPDGPWLADPEFYDRSESTEGTMTRVVAREKYPVQGRDRAYVRLRYRLR